MSKLFRVITIKTLYFYTIFVGITLNTKSNDKTGIVFKAAS